MDKLPLTQILKSTIGVKEDRPTTKVIEMTNMQTGYRMMMHSLPKVTTTSKKYFIFDFPPINILSKLGNILTHPI